MSLSSTYWDAVTGEIAKGLGDPFIMYEGMKKIKGLHLTTSDDIFLCRPMKRSTTSACVTLPLEKWAKINEIATKYSCKNFSQAIAVCIQKFEIDA